MDAVQVLRNALNLVNRVRQLGLYALVLILGVVGVVLGGWYGWHAIDVQRTGLRVDGRVVSVRETNDDPARFEPTYEYRIDGETYVYELTNPTLEARPETGSRRQLLVAADDPHDARVPTFLGLWGTSIVLVVFGLLCFWALWFRTLRRRR